jgi:hypothetical protein
LDTDIHVLEDSSVHPSADHNPSAILHQDEPLIISPRSYFFTSPKQEIPTSDLIKHPITALHFSTLTQNILKISENSQSSLLQKVAKVLVEN